MATVTASYNWVSGETVTPAKLNTTAAPTVVVADNEVTTAKILDANVTNAKLASDIDASKLTTGTLPIARIADAAVTAPKLQNGVTLQTVYAQTTSIIEIETVIPMDNTKPQNTEGEEVLTATITPSSATSKILIQAGITGTLGNVAGTITIAFFRDSVADALASAWVSASSGYGLIVPLAYQDSPSSTSAITYKVRLGYPGTGAGMYVNRGVLGAAIYGGTMTSWMTLTEIKA
jgi:hypothetical protein